MEKNTNKRLVAPILVLAFVAILSFTIRMNYVNTIIELDLYEQISSTQDSREYIHLATNIVKNGRYTNPDSKSRHTGLIRPPGYPVFYALFEYFENAPLGVLKAQVIVSSLIPVFLALLTLLIIKSNTMALIAGLLGSMSAPGIYLTGEIRADLLLAFMFIVGFVMLCYGITREKVFFTIFSGLFFSIGVLTKPILIFWPFFSLIICWCLSKSVKKKLNIKAIAVYAILQILIIVGWSTHNYTKEGLFTLSTISIQTLREYLAVQVRASEEIDYPFSSMEFQYYVGNEKRNVQRQRGTYLTNGISVIDLVNLQMKESKEIIKTSLINTYFLYAKNSYDNFTGRMHISKYFYNLKEAQRNFTNNLLLLAYGNNMFRNIFNIIIVTFLLFTAIFYKKLSSKRSNFYFYNIISFILVYLYFGLLSGVTFWTGPRIVFPADFALLISVLLILKCFNNLYNEHRRLPP